MARAARSYSLAACSGVSNVPSHSRTFLVVSLHRRALRLAYSSLCGWFTYPWRLWGLAGFSMSICRMAPSLENSGTSMHSCHAADVRANVHILSQKSWVLSCELHGQPRECMRDITTASLLVMVSCMHAVGSAAGRHVHADTKDLRVPHACQERGYRTSRSCTTSW